MFASIKWRIFALISVHTQKTYNICAHIVCSWCQNHNTIIIVVIKSIFYNMKMCIPYKCIAFVQDTVIKHRNVVYILPHIQYIGLWYPHMNGFCLRRPHLFFVHSLKAAGSCRRLPTKVWTPHGQSCLISGTSTCGTCPNNGCLMGVLRIDYDVRSTEYVCVCLVSCHIISYHIMLL